MRFPWGNRIALLVVSVALPAWAEPETELRETSEGTHDRIERELSLVIGAGVTTPTPRSHTTLRARYLESVGLSCSYEARAPFGEAAAAPHAVLLGLEVRPLFLARWLTGNSFESPFWDLLVDSFSLGLDSIFANAWSRPGLGLVSGIEVPLFAKADGPWLGFRGGRRFLEERAFGAQGERETILSITLEFHFGLLRSRAAR